MKEIKLTIDGKEVQLTEEQLRMFGIESEKKNPFDRVKKGKKYYFISGSGDIISCTENIDSCDNTTYVESNYFNDEAFAKQVSLHQLLYRKLLKFAYDNECEDTAEWNGSNPHWVIRYNNNRNEFCSYYQDGYKAQDVYFSSKEGAERAIEEVVKPFMRELPEFVW